MSQAQDLIFTPARVAELTHDYLIEQMQNGRPMGVPMGIPALDDYLMPLKGTDMLAVLGRPGGGKSMLLAHLARNASRIAKEYGDYENVGPACVVTAEMAVEDYQIREIANILPMDSRLILDGENNRQDDILNAVEAIRAQTPTFYIGHSMMETRRRPPITIEAIREALVVMRDEMGITPSLLSVDYLQRLKLRRDTRDRRLEINEIVNMLKDLALEFGTRIALGVQAKREVDERAFPVPELGDGQESSAIEQVPEAVVGVMRPVVRYQLGTIIPQTQNNLVCTAELFFLKVLKQRGGEFGKGFWLSMDPRYSRIADLELQRYGDDRGLDEDYL